MNDQMMMNYSQWEQDLFQVPEMGMFYQGFPDANSPPANVDGKSLVNIPDEYQTGSLTSPNLAGGNVYSSMISSPETANPVNTSPGKPKRSRRGKGTASQSTTFLNASIANFRSLVQQHTGCHTNNSAQTKGPITLCFASYASNPEAYAYQFNNQYYS